MVATAREKARDGLGRCGVRLRCITPSICREGEEGGRVVELGRAVNGGRDSVRLRPRHEQLESVDLAEADGRRGPHR